MTPISSATTQDSRITVMTGANLPIRTLHNMNEVAKVHSSCPAAPSASKSTSLEITLTLQTSMNRAWILRKTCNLWRDPIVAVVFVPYSEHQGVVDYQTNERLQRYISICPNLKLIQYLGNQEESKPEKYPVNRMRNVGLDSVTTSHVLVMDVDLIPSQDLQDTIKDALTMQNENKQALVVPAFERHVPKEQCQTEEQCSSHFQKFSSFLPKTFQELQKCMLDKSKCTIFKYKVTTEGHSSTQTSTWLKRKWYNYKRSSDSDNVNHSQKVLREVSCFKSENYEPYLVLEWCGSPSMSTTPSSSLEEIQSTTQNSKATRTTILPKAPYFDERFYGYGKNKVQHVHHLRKSGYRFPILPEGFVIHNPHVDSSTKNQWWKSSESSTATRNNSKNNLRATMNQQYVDFLNELDVKYKSTADEVLPLCRERE